MLPTCSICGTTADDWMALGWATSRQDGRSTYICPSCARENLRAIEGKLPEEYWTA